MKHEVSPDTKVMDIKIMLPGGYINFTYRDKNYSIYLTEKVCDFLTDKQITFGELAEVIERGGI